jgi:hypothetical protein
MALYGPSIPAAVYHTPDGAPQVVHPAADRWWHNLQDLRLASQSNRLSCPDCGQRLVFVCEKVPTPYFRHYRDTEECVEESSAARYERRVQGWLRHQLVVAFRSVLPAATRLECEEYLANRRPSMGVHLPEGGSFTLEVISEPQELAAFLQRQKEGAPLVPVFVGRRIPAAVAEAARQLGSGGLARVALSGLNADHDAAARPLRVDMAHAASSQFYNLPLLAGEPRSLLFFLPGQQREDVSYLLLVRGLMPHPHETAWHARVIKVPMVAGGVGCSLRHGFYTSADVEALRQMRDLFRRRRRGRPSQQHEGADRFQHPLSRAWQAKGALMERAEAERKAQEEAERRRIEQVQREIAEHQAREARRVQEARAEAERRRQADAAWRERTRAGLWQRLQAEGAELLGGRFAAVPHPEAFAVPPAVWQGAFLAFAVRAGRPFTLDHCLDWLRGDCLWVTPQPILPRESWSATVSVRAFLEEVVRRGLLERDGTLMRPTKAWPWPSAGWPAAGTASICLLCGAITGYFQAYDPVTGYCRCTQHQ